jgi:glycerol-3-phosphate dehydrogenase
VIRRDDALETLNSQEFDLVVIGGGITGAGCALDAASRGMSVALVEQADFSSGTSSRSSKLVHGGLRYLQNFDLGLVREALLERRLMVELAPHLVRPLPLIVPSFDGEKGDRAVRVGLNLYDAMSVDRRPVWWRRRKDRVGEAWSPDRHREIDGEEVSRLLPALADRNPTSGYLFYDCQTDDSRLVLTILSEAERFGAVCANRLRVTDLVERHGWVRGVRVNDEAAGTEFEIRSASVVNATGVWADRLRPSHVRDEELPRIAPSRGTHLTFSRERLPIDAGVIVPAGEERTIFALPWLGATLVGTTDNDYDSSGLDHVAPSDGDIDYLLAACNGFFGDDLSRADITGAFAGVRPLISTGDPRKSVDISRRAELYETASGMVTITGGKLTTWRRMAKLAIDRVVERQGRDAPCRTDKIRLGRPISPVGLPPVEGISPLAEEALATRYGVLAVDVLTLARENPSLAEPILADGPPDLLAEVAYAARSEQALSVGDVLLRRTRLGLIAGRRVTAGDGVALRVARTMARELGWDDVRVRQEADRFLEEAEAEGVAPTP